MDINRPYSGSLLKGDGRIAMPVSNKVEQTKPKPYWQSECGRAVVYVGDNLDIMSQMKPEQFHAIVTDPPYGLEFMGQEWDAPWKNNGKIETCDEDTDVSHSERDGTQRVCYGNNRKRKVDTRSHGANELNDPIKSKYIRHNVEYVRDSYFYQEWFHARAQGMLRVAKSGAHLLSFGGTRMWHRMSCAIEDAGFDIRDTVMWMYSTGFPKSHDVSKAIDRELGAERTQDEPITEPACRWNGWGTALKPAYEPIILARKLLSGTIAQNSIDHGCGGLNIDKCRIGIEGGCKIEIGDGGYDAGTVNALEGHLNSARRTSRAGLGRWPTNVIHDGSDEGVSSRFFYTAKAGKDDRPHGKTAITHPTVKPLDLMQYLVRLVCAPGGVVLDPFMGSGSTGCAAILEGMLFVGMEQDEKYADIAIGRLKLALSQRKVEDTLQLITGVTRRTDGVAPPPKKMRS